MAIFDKLGETITTKSKSVAKKAKDFAEVTSLNSQISTEEDAIEKVYLEIGKTYFENNKKNETDPFVELFHTIFDAQSHIEQLRKQIEKIKSVRTCPTCGAQMPLNALFCSSCGAKTGVSPSEEMPAESVPVVKTCAKCGAELPEGSAFCVACGTKVEG